MSNRKLHRISEPFGHGKDNAEKALTRLNDLKIHVNIITNSIVVKWNLLKGYYVKYLIKI